MLFVWPLIGFATLGGFFGKHLALNHNYKYLTPLVLFAQFRKIRNTLKTYARLAPRCLLVVHGCYHLYFSGKSAEYFSFIRSSNSKEERATAGNESLRLKGMQASTTTLEFRRSFSSSKHIGSKCVLQQPFITSIPSRGLWRVHIAHTTSFMFDGSISSSTTMTQRLA